MSSIIYNQCLYKLTRSMINFDTSIFNVLLVDSEYVPDKDGHRTRSDILDNEILNGNGYTKGGISIRTFVSRDSVNNRIEIQLGNATWTNASIIASGAIYYRVTGSSHNDDLVCYVEFDRSVSSIDGEFSITPSVIRMQN